MKFSDFKSLSIKDKPQRRTSAEIAASLENKSISKKFNRKMVRDGNATMVATFVPSQSAHIWRLPAVLSFTGRSRTSLFRDIKDGFFPKPIQLGKGSVGWLRVEIEAWLNKLIAERDGATK